ncbi:hypothetical protein D0N36_06800 [Hymenobacter lapidiphilus]|uniref:hypothetical protein n=1 Tax=Hymenobacter sp. CCM 8763 TaxID=2303334 RepID=UPI000E3447A8|nr:hypothetical protein [Hymenobacter sp. CCM 8763]RFP65906.1 hypothetical protein D0N36_06800 [Hymenobacter sp. CCM 8763]
MQTSEQLAAFRALCKANLLGKADVWQHKQSGNWIIGRAGIEKIQGLNNIQVGIELAAAGADFAIVKAAAVRTVERKKIKVESLGSANAKNSQVSYYAEMAEKRAKSRSILMLMGFYELGVYGEEEADDFSAAKNRDAARLEDEQPAPVAAPAPRPTQPAASAPMLPASVPLVPSAGAALSSEEQDDLPMDKLVVLSFLKEAETLEELQAAWLGEAKGWHLDQDVYAAKEDRKAHLSANQTLATHGR